MTDDELISKAAALLDHYSDRAVAHASFFLASIFGLVAFSSLAFSVSNQNSAYVDDMSLCFFSTFLFWSFAYSGYYTLRRFNFYATVADSIAQKGLKQEKVFGALGIEDFKDRYNQQQTAQILRRILGPAKTSDPFMICAYWIGVGFLDYVTFIRYYYHIIWYRYLSWAMLLCILFLVLVLEWRGRKLMSHKVSTP